MGGPGDDDEGGTNGPPDDGCVFQCGEDENLPEDTDCDGDCSCIEALPRTTDAGTVVYDLIVEYDDGQRVCYWNGYEGVCRNGVMKYIVGGSEVTAEELGSEVSNTATCGSSSAASADTCTFASTTFGKGNEVCFAQLGVHRCEGSNEWTYVQAYCDREGPGDSCQGQFIPGNPASFAYSYEDHEIQCFSDGTNYQCQHGTFKALDSCSTGSTCSAAGGVAFAADTEVCFNDYGLYRCEGENEITGGWTYVRGHCESLGRWPLVHR